MYIFHNIIQIKNTGILLYLSIYLAYLNSPDHILKIYFLFVDLHPPKKTKTKKPKQNSTTPKLKKNHPKTPAS